MTRIILTLFLMLGVSAHAELIPKQGRLDKRIRTAVYNQDQVYRIAAKIGYASYIQFWEGEKMVSFFTGDKNGWDVGTYGALTAFKPKVRHPTTNFVILTDKGRVYNIMFDLNRRKTKGHIIGLRFLYPEEERKKKEAEEDRQTQLMQSIGISYQTRLLELEKKRLETYKKRSREDSIDPLQQDERIRNYHYSASGSDSLRPDQMFDNGRFTFIHFTEDMEWPALFRVKRNKEYMVNTTIRGNWLIVPRISREWHLRLDNEMLCIKNTHFAPRRGDNFNESASNRLFRRAR